MRWILEQMRRVRRGDEGFTLIELLIVILILGILAGIAVFASGPFRDRAEAACTDANTEIGIIADAATDAGVTGDLFAQGPDCSGAGGGTTPVSFTAALEAEHTGTDAGASVSATTGNLLVALAGHRETPDPLSEGEASPPAVADAPTADNGYALAGYAFFETSTGDRRGLGVFTKIADGTDDIDVDWGDGNTSGDLPMDVRVFEFSRTGDDPDWSNSVLSFDSLLDAPTSGAAYGSAAGGTGDGLLIGAMVGRAGPDTMSAFNGGGGYDGGSSGLGSGDVGVWIGFENVTGAGPFSAAFTWSAWNTEVGEGTGIVMVVE